MRLPEDPGQPGRRPNCERSPEVRPGIHGVGRMPEEEAEVSDNEQDMCRVEGLIEPVSDVWQREYADSKKNR